MINYGWIGLVLLAVGVWINTGHVGNAFAVLGLGLCIGALADWIMMNS